ncbi:PorP/SprF family type IX secretion system membrane protein [Flammeovirga kamogawensis]|uniref:Type IX secretion system membrane protein PorP/SprF n=1 Tax=Flammeovirga kamogawensis TaxID=373891 RepID=A0ABX8GT33_9BACT|nr:type IX secretion system membrane protein PorP/SprF [Flammeovirga kamogawensis]MBB6462667.1 type IX secretion system PorP/SprF family membrane protein [Flammeovirga kamogawensis]QWG06095.1 type IX secretion system membrane protein PorP/SprF [Flammeovirga kamogawensis]TRX67927.1 type IX secretion system membrane protein PorP/SprF [Flammeovirga kamogawensis]
MQLIKPLFLSSLLFLFTLSFGVAQQDPQFTQYMFSKPFHNPAAVGMTSENAEASLVHRTQWLGYEGTFDDDGTLNTQFFSLSAPIQSKRLGVGLHIVNDDVGLLSNLEAQVSVSYFVPVKNGTLSFGLRGGVYDRSINTDRLRFVNDQDPFFKSGEAMNSIVPDVSAGIYYQNERLYAGIAAKHLLESDFVGGINSPFSALGMSFNGMFGMSFDVTNNVVLQPSVLLKSDLNSLSFDFTLLANLQEWVYVGAGVREIEALSLLAGVYVLKSRTLHIGYAFDYTLENQSAKAPTSHEILLSFSFSAFGSKKPSAIRTPRYRHD